MSTARLLIDQCGRNHDVDGPVPDPGQRLDHRVKPPARGDVCLDGPRLEDAVRVVLQRFRQDPGPGEVEGNFGVFDQEDHRRAQHPHRDVLGPELHPQGIQGGLVALNQHAQVLLLDAERMALAWGQGALLGEWVPGDHGGGVGSKGEFVKRPGSGRGQDDHVHRQAVQRDLRSVRGLKRELERPALTGPGRLGEQRHRHRWLVLSPGETHGVNRPGQRDQHNDGTGEKPTRHRGAILATPLMATATRSWISRAP